MCLYQNEREYMVSRQRCLFFPLHVVKVIKELEEPLVEAEEFSSVYIQLICQNWFSVKNPPKKPKQKPTTKTTEALQISQSFVTACSLKRA